MGTQKNRVNETVLLSTKKYAKDYGSANIYNFTLNLFVYLNQRTGAQWLSGRVLDLRPRGRRFKPHRCHCVVSLSKNINPRLVLVQPRKTCPFITERLLMGCKESNQTNKPMDPLFSKKRPMRPWIAHLNFVT